MHLTLPPNLHATVEARLAGLDADRLVARLAQRDPTLWSADPARHEAITGRLGWLGLPEAMERESASLRAFAAEVAAEGFTRAVLLGMGGSSLAPEVLRLTHRVRRGSLELTILDDTSPDAVAAVGDTHDPSRTLLIVSSKSGSTLETSSLERHFFEWARAARGAEAGRAFVAITDPATPLERLALERGYRRVFAGIPDVGGRYSALSAFGLMPAALLGVDLDRLLTGARAELAPLLAGLPARDIPGVRLGAALGELALRGRDKLTLLIDPRFAALGVWIEQLVAESTGKEGQGIVPVIEEPLATPDLYGQDRVFVALGEPAAARGTGGSLAALRAAGQPVLAWDPEPHGLGAEFARWEVATATAAAVLGVNPFDEPNVTEAKQATQAALERHRLEGRFPGETALAAAGGWEARAPTGVGSLLRPGVAAPADPLSWVSALVGLARPGDYLALLAWFRRTETRHARLQRLRERLRASGRIATTLGYGPRYLHSTGQLHKGGSGRGLFLLLTADPGADRAILGRGYGFATLHRAQAEGDYAALGRRGLRLLRLHLGSDVDAGLEALVDAFAATGGVE